MHRFLFLDKDGTAIRTKSGATFVASPWDQEPIEGVMEKLSTYAAEGWRIVIISNQGGVAANHKSFESCVLEMRFCLELFPQIEECFFCPDFEGLECWRVWGDCSEQYRILYKNEISTVGYGVDGGNPDGHKSVIDPAKNYRKPNPGMLNLATEIHAPESLLYVGDRPEDQAAAIAANVPFLWAEEWLKNGL